MLDTVTAGLVPVAAGFLLAFGIHFFFYSDAALSWRYLTYDFGNLFFREVYYEGSSFRVWWLRLVQAMGFAPVSFIVLAGAAVVFVVAEFFRGENRRWPLIAAGGLLVALVLVNVMAGTRGRVRDILWREVALHAVALRMLVTVWHVSGRPRRWAPVMVVLLAAVLLGGNIVSAVRMPGADACEF